MNQQEWDQHWHDNATRYNTNRDLAHLRPYLAPLLKGKIADLGCGVTNMYGPQHDVTGVDISPECARIMQEKCPTGTWRAADVRTTGLPSSTFDTVLSSHVLEHFYDQEPLVAEMKRIAKPDGNVIIVVPRRSIGPDHVHPKWWPAKIEERIACHLRSARYELVARNHWLIQGKKTATVTLVMPAWSPDEHRLKLMQGCLTALRERTKYPYQLVIVDNGPGAQTEAVIAAGPDVHIANKVLHNPGSSRNQGAAAARGDYLAFLDNDMEVYEDWLADAVALLEQYPDRKLIAVPTECPLARHPDNIIGPLDGKHTLTKAAGSGCWVMKRRTFDEIGPWDEHGSVEDYEYAVRAGSADVRFVYRNAEPWVRHRAWHKRTFQSHERFADGRWMPDLSDKRGAERAKRLLLAEYARRFGPKVFVETGTYKGDTVKAMLLSGLFTQIHSIDLEQGRADGAAKRFKSFPHIHCWHGDSARILPVILQDLHEPALFWLDAHASCEQVAETGAPTPLPAELDAVLTHECAADHVILIDDARYYTSSFPGYPTLDELKAAVLTRLPQHVFEVETDVIRIHRGEGR